MWVRRALHEVPNIYFLRQVFSGGIESVHKWVLCGQKRSLTRVENKPDLRTEVQAICVVSTLQFAKIRPIASTENRISRRSSKSFRNLFRAGRVSDDVNGGKAFVHISQRGESEPCMPAHLFTNWTPDQNVFLNSYFVRELCVIPHLTDRYESRNKV